MLLRKKNQNSQFEDAPILTSQKINENYNRFLEIMSTHGFPYEHLVENDIDFVQKTGKLYISVLPRSFEDGKKTSIVSTDFYSHEPISTFFDITGILSGIYSSKTFGFWANDSNFKLEEGRSDDPWHEMQVYVDSKKLDRNRNFNYLSKTTDILLGGENLLEKYLIVAKANGETERPVREKLLNDMAQLHSELVEKTGYQKNLRELQRDVMDNEPRGDHYEDESVQFTNNNHDGTLSINVKIRPKLPIDFGKFRQMISHDMVADKITVDKIDAGFTDEKGNNIYLGYFDNKIHELLKNKNREIDLRIWGEEVGKSIDSIYTIYERVKTNLL
jgi:hypothetical protein